MKIAIRFNDINLMKERLFNWFCMAFVVIGIAFIGVISTDIYLDNNIQYAEKSCLIEKISTSINQTFIRMERNLEIVKIINLEIVEFGEAQ